MNKLREEAERLVAELENLVSDGANGETAARKCLRNLLTLRLAEPPEGTNLGEAVDALAAESGPQHALEASSLIRAIGAERLIGPGIERSIERSTVALIQSALPALSNLYNLSQKAQTFEKYAKIRAIHSRAEEVLSPFSTLPADLDTIISARQMLTKALNDPFIKAYCSPFHIAEIRAGFDLVQNKIGRLSQQSTNLANELMECRRAVNEQLAFCEKHINFLTRGSFVPFLHSTNGALDSFFVTVRGKFQANIVPRLTDGGSLQKRYPFKEEGRRIRLGVPLKNGGPGTALGVTVKVEAEPEQILFAAEELHLGSVAPGDFSAVFEAEVMSASDAVDLLVSVAWNQIGDSERREQEFVASANAQRCDIDWQSQSHRRPYSTEVAKGETFVGRTEKVQSLASKMLRTPMESFYVTGQKRVGKTSLALAAAAFASEHAPAPGIQSKYILWGSIANADPIASMKELGEQIAQFITRTLPSGVEIPKFSFEGSISSLVKLADLAAELRPGLKYVVIIDEFDELHPELYQHGNLAETFFANIRAITTCDNMCVVLVGGENMPFIMDRQGQKLNKLVRVPLDYFSRGNEWDDFKLLVTKPAEGVLEWHEDAISAVFAATNGNPFFTKIVCAAVFDDCVRERDSDVTPQEVAAALNAEVPTFDSNAFAHLWQDGIHKPVAEREPDVLRRCRTLVLVSRARRRGLAITLENLLSQKHGLMLADSEVVPVLNNFVGRGVLRESQGQYDFVLPIFGRWLVEVGGTRLIADALGEELAEQVKTAEDEAFVRSDEVTSLVRRWPTYQGREIGTDEVRAWFEQVDGHQSQRLLFKILQNLKFYSDVEVREKLKTLHSFVRPMLPEFIIRKRTDRREDVFITYADGEGKSGQFYGSRYAESNNLSAKSIINPYAFSEAARERIASGKAPSVLLFLDDLVATGKSLAKNLTTFVSANEPLLRELDIPMIALALSATPDGEDYVRQELSKFDWLKFDLRHVDLVGPGDCAFCEGAIVWANAEEQARAKALCEDLGALIYPYNPLGFGNQGLLMVFPVNCPNNSLPILHSPSRSDASQAWNPLFPRAVH